MKKLLTLIIAIIFIQGQAFGQLSFSPLIHYKKLAAGMDINVLAGDNYESAEQVKLKSKTFGLEYENEESLEAHKTAAGSLIKSVKGIELEAGRNATIQGSELKTTSTEAKSSIKAGNDINILNYNEEHYSYYKKEEQRVDFSKALGNAPSYDKGHVKLASVKGEQHVTEIEESTTKAKGSVLDLAGSLELTAGNNINVIGSEVIADEIEANAGNKINILSVQQQGKYRGTHQGNV
jgi:filamentous hemagglutinin